MTRRRLAGLFTVLACTLPCVPSLALDQPEGSARDGRIQVVDYDESDVVAVDVSLTSATQITFSPGEEVLDLASGFSQGWEFVNRRNQLYLKARSVRGMDGTAVSPVAGQWNTNLIVTTTARVYTFQLNARAERPDKSLGYDPNIAFRVEFRYPAEAARKAHQEAAARAAKQSAQRKSVPRNWQYTMQVGPDSDAIVPSMAYDDGLFTYLRFPRTAEFPSAFVEVAGKESIVNTHVTPSAPSVLVIHQVAERFNLRLGDQVVAVFNEAFDRRSREVAPMGASGTSVPGMRRTVRQADDATRSVGGTP
jgi:P-type conjugative transfer protein VirB9